ncbi:MAG: hypothetical protein IKJ65_03930 [Clostridia bacterium]|nr:hypothetical protein [Clostridia bacterium]
MFSSALNDILFTLVPARPNSVIRADFAREIDQNLINDFQRAAEKALSKPVSNLLASDWIHHPDVYFACRLERREILFQLVLGEFVTQSGRYIDKIIDLSWAITEEATWSEARDIAQVDRCEEDNFAFETASLLSWAWHLCGAAIGAKSKYALNRIEDSVSLRILAPFARQEAPEWTKKRGERTFERLLKLLTAFLLIDTRDKRRWVSIRRIFHFMDLIIKDVPADGVHPVNIETWLKDLAALSDASRLILYATDGRVDLAADKKYARMADYAVSAHMGQGLFVNPDGAPAPILPGETVFKIGFTASNPSLQKLGAMLAKGQSAAPGASVTDKIMTSLVRRHFLSCSARCPVRKRVSLPIGKLVSAYQSGFQAALTGGSGISGHEDACNLFITYLGEAVFFDTGAGRSRALYHSCPTVNGIFPDKGFSGAKDVEARFEEAYTYLFANMAQAFPQSANVTSWQRTVMLSPFEKRVRVVESYDLVAPAESVVIRYVTPVRPEKTPTGNIRIGNTVFSSETGLPIRITPLENAWALEIDVENPGMRGTHAFALEGE